MVSLLKDSMACPSHLQASYSLRLDDVLGDIDPTEGVDHAKCIARKIAASGSDAPKYVYSSPFLRTAHTAQLVALDTTRPSVRIEEGKVYLPPVSCFFL